MRVLARPPARRRGHDALEDIGAHGHERRAARGHQPLVGVADDDVEARGVDRQPAARLRGVDERERAVLRRGRGDRVEVGHLAGRHLHRAERDDVRSRSRSRSASSAAGRGARRPRALLDEEREQHRGELDVGGEHARAVRDRRGDEPTSSETVAPIATVSAATPTSARERRPRALGRVAPVLPARAPAAPVLERAPAARPTRSRAAGRSSRCSATCRAGATGSRLRRSPSVSSTCPRK